ncbi:MAE_28990/MAE_18760 family HEPN-like nuclease [Haliangium sp.]|uniref:MAE_28990/MAE_18760 family HEPN-like nuclease n=1 Tax=Haliangium sp. TaxID=2663208 RepID=UPI003D0C5B1D
MRSTLDELNRELAELRTLIDSIAPVDKALSEHQDSVVQRYRTIRRRFDEAAVLVALYASFERFAENLVDAYVQLVAKQRPYRELPSMLVKKHMAESAEMLRRGRLGEGRYIGLNEVDVVKNLLSCIEGNIPYVLNMPAIIAHDNNLRYNELQTLFATAGIKELCVCVCRAEDLIEWHARSQDIQPPSEVPNEALRARLDDLVERRNEVAHRGRSPDQLLGTEEMRNLVDFIEALARATFASTTAMYLKQRYVEPGEATPLHRTTECYKRGTVVVVERPQCILRLEQPLFVLAEKAPARWGRIISMHVDDTPVEMVDETTDAEEIGLELDFKCPKSTKTAHLFVLDVEDDAVWCPSGRPFNVAR